MKKHLPLRVLILSLVTLFALTLVAAKALCRCRHSLDARGWGLQQFVDHLAANEIRLHVVPSRADGRWSDNIYLTCDPEATWDSFQRKSMNPERIRQWRGAVWVHRIGPDTDVEGRLADWGRHGCLVGGFLVFGDTALLDRIRGTFPAQASVARRR